MGVGFLYYRTQVFQTLKIVQTTLRGMKVKTVQIFSMVLLRHCHSRV